MEKLTNGMFPSEFVSVKEKSTEGWLKQYAQAATRKGATSTPGRYTQFREKVIRNNKYTAGTQDSSIYQTKIEGENNVANLALNYDTANPIGTFVKNIVGQLQNQDYKIQFKSISPATATRFDKEFKRLKRIKAISKKKDQFAEAGVDISKYIVNEEIFETEDEIELHLELNLKDDAALALTIATQYVLDLNKYEDLERRILGDIVKHNWGAVYVEAREDGHCVIRVPQLEKLVFDYFEEEDASDCRYIGEARSVSINELRKMADGQLTNKELFEAARQGAAGSSFPYSFDQLQYYKNGDAKGMPWGGMKTTVYDLKILSVNEETGYNVPDRRSGGYKFIKSEKLKKVPEGAERVTREIENQYKVKYIPALDKVIDYGICYSPRERKEGKWSTNYECDYIMFAQDIHEMVTSSIVDQLIGKADDWILIKLNIMRMIAQAHPAGVAVDQMAVAAAANGFGEGNITPRGLIDIFTKRGVFIYSSMVHGRALQNQNPIRDTAESTLISLERMQKQMFDIISEMEIISGVPYSTISAPDKDTAVGNNKIALSNRNNSLRNIDLAYKNIANRMGKKIGSCIQDAVISGKSIMDYGQAIGYMNLDAIKATKAIPSEEFGTMVDTAPDGQDQQDVIDSLNLAIQNKSIRASIIPRIKQEIRRFPARAAKMLVIEERQYADIQNKAADERSRVSAEAMAKAGKDTEMAKVMTINAEWDRRDAHVTLEFRHKKGLSHQDYLEEARIQYQKDQAKLEQIKEAMEGDSNEESGEGNYASKDMPKESGNRMPAIPAVASQ